MHQTRTQARMGRDQHGVGTQRMAEWAELRKSFHHTVFADRPEVPAIELRTA